MPLESELVLDISAALEEVSTLEAALTAVTDSFGEGIAEALSFASDAATSGLGPAFTAITDDFGTSLSAALADVDTSGFEGAVQDALSNAMGAGGGAGGDLTIDTSSLEQSLDGLTQTLQEMGDQMGQVGDAGQAAMDDVSTGAEGATRSLRGSQAAGNALFASLTAVSAGALGNGLPASLRRLSPYAATIGGVTAAVEGLARSGAEAQLAQERLTTVFGDQAKAVQRVKYGDINMSLQELARTSGTLPDKLELAVAKFGQLGTSSGHSATEAANVSQKMAVLAAQLATTNPTLGDAAAVTTRLQFALSRGGIALQRLGLSVKPAEVTAQLLRNGGDAADRFDKASATLDVILQHLGGTLSEQLATGAKSATVQFRELQVEVKENLQNIGMALLPAVLDLTHALTPLGIAFSATFGRGIGAVVKGVADGLHAALDWAQKLGEQAKPSFDELSDAADRLKGAIGPIETGLQGVLKVAGAVAGSALLGGLRAIANVAEVVAAAFEHVHVLGAMLGGLLGGGLVAAVALLTKAAVAFVATQLHAAFEKLTAPITAAIKASEARAQAVQAEAAAQEKLTVANENAAAAQDSVTGAQEAATVATDAKIAADDAAAAAQDQLVAAMQAHAAAADGDVAANEALTAALDEFELAVLNANTALEAQEAALAAASAAAAEYGAALEVIPAAEAEVTAATEAMDVAMDANPIGLIVLGLTAALTIFGAFQKGAKDVGASMADVAKKADDAYDKLKGSKFAGDLTPRSGDQAAIGKQLEFAQGEFNKRRDAVHAATKDVLDAEQKLRDAQASNKRFQETGQGEYVDTGKLKKAVQDAQNARERVADDAQAAQKDMTALAQAQARGPALVGAAQKALGLSATEATKLVQGANLDMSKSLDDLVPQLIDYYDQMAKGAGFASGAQAAAMQQTTEQLQATQKSIKSLADSYPTLADASKDATDSQLKDASQLVSVWQAEVTRWQNFEQNVLRLRAEGYEDLANQLAVMGPQAGAQAAATFAASTDKNALKTANDAAASALTMQKAVSDKFGPESLGKDISSNIVNALQSTKDAAVPAAADLGQALRQALIDGANNDPNLKGDLGALTAAPSGPMDPQKAWDTDQGGEVERWIRAHPGQRVPSSPPGYTPPPPPASAAPPPAAPAGPDPAKDKKDAEDAAKKAAEAAKKAAEDAANALKAAQEKVAGAIRDLANKIKSFAPTFQTAFDEVIAQPAGEAAKKLADSVPKLTDAFSDLGDKLGDNLKQLQDKVPTLESVLQKATSLGGLQGGLRRTIRDFRAFVSELQTLASRGYSDLASAIAQMGPEAGKRLARQASKASSDTLNQLRSTITTVQGFQGGLDPFAGVAPGGLQALDADLAQRENRFNQFVQNLDTLRSRGFGDLADQLAEEGADKAGAIAQQAARSSDAGLQPIEDRVKRLMQLPVDLEGKFTVSLKSISDKLAQQRTDYAEWTADLAKIKTQVGPDLTAALSQLGPQKGLALARQALKDPSIAKTLDEQLKGHLGDLALAENVFGSNDIGTNFAIGFAQGIEAGQNFVTDAAKNVALAATQTVKDTLKIKSPSEVMAEHGGFFTEGFAKGIRTPTSHLRAAEEVALAAVGAFGRHEVSLRSTSYGGNGHPAAAPAEQLAPFQPIFQIETPPTTDNETLATTLAGRIRPRLKR
jgi:hypothetical protein